MNYDLSIVNFACEIYRSTSSIRPEEFRFWALVKLSSLVSYDSACWLAGATASDQLSTVTRVNAPERFVSTLVEGAGGWLNRLHATPDCVECPPAATSLLEPFGFAAALGVSHRNSQFQTRNTLILCREDAIEFSQEERSRVEVANHLLSDAAHFAFSHAVIEAGNSESGHAAICDRLGHIHEAQPTFLALISSSKPGWNGTRLPFSVPERQPANFNADCGLHVSTQTLGDFFLVKARRETPADRLTPREMDIVKAICAGNTFKETARSLQIAPSTVANGFYRILRKLNLNNRTELRNLMSESQDEHSHATRGRSRPRQSLSRLPTA